MSPSPTDRFRIEAVFDALVDLSTDEQMAYLDRTASDDPELREEVLRLLQAHRRSEGFLEAPLAQVAKGLFDDAEPLAPGGTPDRIGPWHIVRPIGRGGMATVYLAQDLRHDRPIAVKVLHPELAATLGPERFQREIRVAAQLQHPQILPVYDSGADAGVLWFTMPYVEGETLRQRLQRTGALPVAGGCTHSGLHRRALAYAHRRGVIHRDVKPENVLLSQENVFLADFGVAKPVDARGQSVPDDRGLVVGTPTYMAPEQAAADPATDHRADIYAFGILAYELLAGEPPFANLPLGLLFAAHAIREPEPIARRRPDVPPPLASLIARCLRKDPAERWDSAEALCGVLQATALPGPSSSMAERSPHPAYASRLPPSPVRSISSRRGRPSHAPHGARPTMASAQRMPPASWRLKTWSASRRPHGGCRMEPRACARGNGRTGNTSNAASLAPRRGLRSPWRRTISTDWLGPSGRDGFAALSGTWRTFPTRPNAAGFTGSGSWSLWRVNGSRKRPWNMRTGRSRSLGGSATPISRRWRCRTEAGPWWRLGG